MVLVQSTIQTMCGVNFRDSLATNTIMRKSKELSLFIAGQLKKILSYVYGFLKTIWQESPYSVVLFIIMIFAIILRTYMLESLPSGISKTELDFINKFKEVGDQKKIWLGKNFNNGLFIFTNSLIYRLLGLKVYYFRAFSALIGIGTIFLTYLFTKEWFNKQSAYLAGLLLAFSSWHVTISRNIDPSVLQPLFILLIFYFASHAFRTKKLPFVFLSGIFLGLSVYISSAFLILPLFLLIAAVYFYFKNKKFLNVYIKEISIVSNVFLLVSLPFFYSLFKRPYAFIGEYSFLGIKDSLYNFGDIVLSLFGKGVTNNFHNLGNTPLLDPFTVVVFFIGIFYVIFNWKSRKNFFLLMWIFIMSLPAVFSANFFDKIYVILPAIYILAAVTLDYLLSEWFTTFPLNKKARMSMVFLVGLLFLLTFSYNYKKYFIAWAGSKDAKSLYSSDISLIK